MANRNTYVPKHTLVKARRIRKVMKAILPTHPESDAEAEEMERDLRLLYFLNRKIEKEIDTCGDNYTFEFHSQIDEFEALEVKYLKAPKEALKGL